MFSLALRLTSFYFPHQKNKSLSFQLNLVWFWPLFAVEPASSFTPVKAPPLFQYWLFLFHKTPRQTTLLVWTHVMLVNDENRWHTHRELRLLRQLARLHQHLSSGCHIQIITTWTLSVCVGQERNEGRGAWFDCSRPTWKWWGPIKGKQKRCCSSSSLFLLVGIRRNVDFFFLTPGPPSTVVNDRDQIDQTCQPRELVRLDVGVTWVTNDSLVFGYFSIKCLYNLPAHGLGQR